MTKAVLNGVILAESDHTEIVEGNRYFPPESVNQEYFESSDLHTTCVWKGTASYYNITVNGKTLENAAWYYPSPSEAAQNIKDYVAFYGGKVEIEN